MYKCNHVYTNYRARVYFCIYSSGNYCWPLLVVILVMHAFRLADIDLMQKVFTKNYFAASAIPLKIRGEGGRMETKHTHLSVAGNDIKLLVVILVMHAFRLANIDRMQKVLNKMCRGRV